VGAVFVVNDEPAPRILASAGARRFILPSPHHSTP
jgi:hypothetical protein